MMFEVKEVVNKNQIARIMINSDNIAFINDLDGVDPSRMTMPPELRLSNCAIRMMDGTTIHVKETMNELAAFFNSEERKKK